MKEITIAFFINCPGCGQGIVGKSNPEDTLNIVVDFEERHTGCSQVVPPWIDSESRKITCNLCQDRIIKAEDVPIPVWSDLISCFINKHEDCIYHLEKLN